ncbi:SUKH-4 family immunity protein [Clavibacter sp. CT19]|uniref:SUKH-4 family immunity protein n=1 Tax=unclassified Clavibacter TaxID=2626594 RepID=UPI0022EA2419|nr:SUKH-4 family immunity protein [Clavibacter sp. CT19]MDA3804476.1 SUKH-4 family immunity protein [Clavibacter sp. CT19]
MKLDDALLAQHGRSPGVEDLLGKELPEFDRADPRFGFVFMGPERSTAGRRDFLAFAEVVDEGADRIGLDVSTGEVRAFSLDSGRTAYVNDSVSSLLFFLDHMIAFAIIVDELDPDPPPMTLTVEESQRLVERFERGELRPRVDRSKTKENQAILKRELRALRALLRERDAKALRGSAWWGRVIDEFSDVLV